MNTWTYHLALAGAVVTGAIAVSFWLVHAGLPTLSRVELLSDSPALNILMLGLGIVP